MLNQESNRLKFTDIGIVIMFTILLIGMGIAQTGLKENPQKIMIGFSGIILTLKLFKEKTISSILFYILMGILIYNVFFMGIGYIVHNINPDTGWTEIDGRRERVMNMNWIWGVLGGIVFSPLIVIGYHKSMNRNKMLELIFIGILMIMMTIIFIK